MRPETATSLFEFLSVKLLELEPKESDKVMDNNRDDSMVPVSRTDASIDALSSYKMAESKIEMPSQK